MSGRFTRKAVWRGLGYLLMLLSFYFLGSRFQASWSEMVSGWQRIQAGYLLASFLLTGGMLLLMPIGWKAALAASGFPLKARRAASIYFRTSLFRYLPGSFWQLSARAVVARQYGISLALYSASSFLELFFLLAAGGIFSGMGLAYYFNNPFFLLVSAAAGLAVPIVLFAGARLGWGGRRLMEKKRPGETAACLLALGGCYLLVWPVYGAAVYLLLNAFPEPYGVGMVPTIGLNTLAWFIGFLSLSPGGLGVREMGLALLLPPEYQAMAVLAVLVQRFMEMSWEALLWLMATVLNRKRSRGDPGESKA